MLHSDKALPSDPTVVLNSQIPIPANLLEFQQQLNPENIEITIASLEQQLRWGAHLATQDYQLLRLQLLVAQLAMLALQNAGLRLIPTQNIDTITEEFTKKLLVTYQQVFRTSYPEVFGFIRSLQIQQGLIAGLQIAAAIGTIFLVNKMGFTSTSLEGIMVHCYIQLIGFTGQVINLVSIGRQEEIQAVLKPVNLMDPNLSLNWLTLTSLAIIKAQAPELYEQLIVSKQLLEDEQITTVVKIE